MTKKIKPDFGCKLRLLRKAQGWTQQDLADRAGMAEASNISHFENGNRQPTMPVLRRLADALGVSLGEFD